MTTMDESKPPISPKLYKALKYAFMLHGHDARKSSSVPYMAHLLSVCALVIQDGGDEQEAIAALLHDGLEDKPELTSDEEIRSRFGDRVLRIIKLATDTPEGYQGGPKPPWIERKEAYLEHIRETEPDLLRVTIADKIDNARAMLADHKRLGDALWKRFNAGKEQQKWYYRASVKAYQDAGVKGPLLEELEQLVKQMELL